MRVSSCFEGGASRDAYCVKSARNFGLDLLRSLAIVIVLSNHYFLGLYVSSGKVAWRGGAAAVSALSVLSIEWLFVLSGFLIGAMMIRSFESGKTWWARARDFWLRRWFRTMPNYYLFVLVNLLLSAVGIGVGAFSFRFVVFSQNLAWAEDQPLFFGEAWSLALDEWFYFLMPLLVGISSWVFRLQPRTAFLVVACALILFPTVGRFFMPPPAEFLQWDANVRRVTIFHLDATGWGVLSAIASRWMPQYWSANRNAKALVGALLTVLGVLLMEWLLFYGWSDSLQSRIGNAVLLTLPAAGAFLMLPWLTSMSPIRGPVSWVVDRISLYSYSLYLCHIPVILITKAWFDVDAGTSLPIMIAASVAWLATTLLVSVLLFHYFEDPTSRLRERYTRRVSASPFESTPFGARDK